MLKFLGFCIGISMAERRKCVSMSIEHSLTCQLSKCAYYETHEIAIIAVPSFSRICYWPVIFLNHYAFICGWLLWVIGRWCLSCIAIEVAYLWSWHPYWQVTVAYNKDPSPVKLNLGVGAYRTEVSISIFLILCLDLVYPSEFALQQFSYYVKGLW